MTPRSRVEHELPTALAMKVLDAAVMPAPWVKVPASDGVTASFINKETGLSSLHHPLLSLAAVVESTSRECLQMPEEERDSWLACLHEQWTREAAMEYHSWQAVTDSKGREYFYHKSTGQAMWSRPTEAILPGHYMKIESVKKLRDEGFMFRLRAECAERLAEVRSVPRLGAEQTVDL